MNSANQTAVTFFIIKGISDNPIHQPLTFLLVLLMYIVILVGNLTIFIIVCLSPQLHTPMYFFLCNLSILDISSSTVTLHKTLSSFVSGDKTVSSYLCIAQTLIFVSLLGNELMLLTAMSYDRYVAVCKPLHYSSVMGPGLCAALATLCWVFGFIESAPTFILIYRFSCYKSNIINHFFCDIVPIMKLVFNDTSLTNLFIFLCGLFHSIFSLLFTFIPYIFIIIAILKISSSSGKRKAFYTCSSHLSVVILLYGTLICQYMRPVSVDGLESGKFFSLFNTVAVPLLNPLIYSLKNKDVKSALRHLRHQMARKLGKEF
ncbi:olfactory receptor 5AR1-like [Dendropsophus ebraccatus]|uniref:olfactory receptor 5AR1-like n=1 Tax=Dendropsophus ebraccatus TaxID=150705 RepID=UPI003831AD54